MIADEEWRHIAGTWDGSEIKLYVDGVEQASTSFSEELTTSDLPVKIGLLHDKYPFQGLLDEVAIFDQALTEAEVKEIMNQGLGAQLAVQPYTTLASTWASIKN